MFESNKLPWALVAILFIMLMMANGRAKGEEEQSDYLQDQLYEVQADLRSLKSCVEDFQWDSSTPASEVTYYCF